MKIAILDDWFDTLTGLPCFARLDGLDVTVWKDHVTDTEALAERLKDTDILVLFRERTAIGSDLLARLPNLKLISQRGAYPHLDVDACTRSGVLLCSKQPSGSSPNHAAAELTWGLILAAMRQIPQQMAALKQGIWQIGVGKSLRCRTLGLYGYGRIARVVAGYAEAFGMNLTWWSSPVGRDRAHRDGQLVAKSRETFFAEADVISLHVRLTPDTRGLITSEDFRHMRRDALFVNTSRAGLIAPGALLEGLNNGRPGMAAVDVFDVEPMTESSDPLLSHPNLIGTPHIGFVTEDEMDRQFGDIFEQVVEYLNGRPIHMINPEVWRAEADV